MVLHLTSSVGRDAHNDSADVRVVQAALTEAAGYALDARLDPGPLDGLCGDGTEGAIAHLQRRLGIRRPDAVIDPGGYTARRLAAYLRIGRAEIIFPLAESSRWPYVGPGAGMRAFAASRSGGKRAHAGSDLYAPEGTPVYAMADGVVVRGPYRFYAHTDALEVDHGVCVVRYGEIAPGSAKALGPGHEVRQGQLIARVGRLMGIQVPSAMLHLEMYDKTEAGALTRTKLAGAVDRFTGRPFCRRKDLVDPSGILHHAPLPVVG